MRNTHNKDGQRKWKLTARILEKRSDIQCRTHALKIEKFMKDEMWNAAMDEQLQREIRARLAEWQQESVASRSQLIAWDKVAAAVEKHASGGTKLPHYACWKRFQRLNPVEAAQDGINVEAAHPPGSTFPLELRRMDSGEDVLPSYRPAAMLSPAPVHNVSPSPPPDAQSAASAYPPLGAQQLTTDPVSLPAPSTESGSALAAAQALMATEPASHINL
jgi:hypothetical protein